MAPTSYDFVILGGGTAGLVLATRLSEDLSQRILVLEAGADLSEDSRVRIPALYQSLLESEADWCFQTEPQPNLNGRSVSLSQGKALLGSSAINAQIFVPPTWTVLDNWGSILGNDGWNQSTL
ncbi:glucose-methanol-choline oxidoreductase [Xylariaceae sp. FL0662B]|nr:glucose-methanol-choline oxidoreductase [Xylariaceae sp. FL0662B]